MLGYVVDGRVIPHSNLVNNAFPRVDVFFSDGTEKTKAFLNKLGVKRKKKPDENDRVIEPPRYRVSLLSSQAEPLYMWDIISVGAWVERNVYSKTTFYLKSTKTENTPMVRMTGSSLSTYMVLVEILFGHLEQFEDRTNVPVTILEKFLRYTYYLSPEGEAWDELADMAGFDSIRYEPEYDVVSVTCAGSVYPVKRALLRELARIVAPLITRLLYRSTEIYVGTQLVSMCELYYIKKRLDEEVKLEYLGRDYSLTETDLRALHTAYGLNALMNHARPLVG